MPLAIPYVPYWPVAADLFPNPTYPQILATVNTGDTDLYTVPSGRRALTMASYRVFNPSAGSILPYIEMKVGGVYYRLGAQPTVGSGGANAVSPVASMVLEAGESLSINTTTTNGLEISGNVIEIDATSPITRALVTSFTNGDNTLYTVPTGKRAFLLGSVNAGVPTLAAVSTAIAAGANTNVSVYTYMTPSGGSQRKQEVAGTVGVQPSSRVMGPLILSAGDVLGLNVVTGASLNFAYALLIERAV